MHTGGHRNANVLPTRKLFGGLRLWRAWVALVVVAVSLLVPTLAFAAEVSLEVSAQQITQDETLQIQVKATGEFDELTQPAAEGWTLQETGRNTQISIVNGAMSRVAVFVFEATPTRTGSFTIGPVALRRDGQTIAQSRSVAVKVVSVASTAVVQSAQQAMDLTQYVGQTFFLLPAVNTIKPYVGQTIEVSWDILWSRRVRVLGIRPASDPSVVDHDFEDLRAEPGQPQSVEFGGRPYQRQLTHRIAVTPLRAGKLRIVGPAFKAEVGDHFEAKVQRIQAATLEIDVQPLPTAGKPAQFDPGAIGNLRLTAKAQAAGKTANRLEVQVGERVLLQYEVEGKGNLLGIRPIAPPPLRDMLVEALPGRGEDGVTRGADGISQGKRTFQYMLSFSRPGVFVLPEQAWASFDADNGKYQSSTVAPLEVVVVGDATAAAASPAPAAADPASGGQTPENSSAAKADPPGQSGLPPDAVLAPATAAGDLAVLLPKLAPLATTAALASTSAAPLSAKPWFWPMAAAPWLAAALGVLLQIWRRRQAAAAPMQQRAQALPKARSALATAVRLGPEEGFTGLRLAVFTWLAETTGATFVSSEGQSRAALQARQVPPEQVAALCDLLAHCEYARFAPGGDRQAELVATAGRIEQILGQIDPYLHAAERQTTKIGIVTAGVLCLVCWLPVAGEAATLDSAFAQATAALERGDAVAASRHYADILQHGLQAPAVHYNLATALLAQGKAGEAVAHYQQALRLGPDPQLAQACQHNLALIRQALSDRARRNHTILHVFDEAPALDEWLAASAPRQGLAVAALALGLLALLWLALSWVRPLPKWPVAVLAALQVLSLLWLVEASHVDATVRRGVIVQEDVTLQSCREPAEPIGLPEGLGFRLLGVLADGRLEVRLASGRQGCLPPDAVYLLDVGVAPGT